MHLETVPVDLHDWKWQEGILSPDIKYPEEWGVPKLEQEVYYKIWWKDNSSQSVHKALSIVLDKGIPALQAAGID